MLTSHDIKILKLLNRLLPGFESGDPSLISSIKKRLNMLEIIDADEVIRYTYLFYHNYRPDGDYENIGDDLIEYDGSDYSDENIAAAMFFDTIPEDIDGREVISTGVYFLLFNDYDSITDYAVERATELFENDLPSDENSFLANYVTMSDYDRQSWADEEAESRVENMDDDDVFDDYSSRNKLEEIENDEEKFTELTDQLDELKDELDNLDSESDPRFAELETEIDDIEYEISKIDSDFDNRKSALVDELKEEIRDDISKEIYYELRDPVQYFVKDQGIYSFSDLIKSNFISVDYDEAAKDAVNQDGEDNYMGYDHNDEITYNGITYYIYYN